MKLSILSIVTFLLISVQSFSQNFINAYTDKTDLCTLGRVDYMLHRITTDNMNNVINTSMYSGTIEVGGNLYPSNGPLSTIIIKRDANDSLIWAKELGSGDTSFVADIYTDNQCNLYVTGYFGHATNPTVLDCYPFPINNPGGFRTFVVKYAPDGTVLWSSSIHVNDVLGGKFRDLFKISGNGTNRIAITSPLYTVTPQSVGTSTIDPADGNLFYAVIDENGNWQYATVLGGTSDHLFTSIAMANNDEVYISGVFQGDLILGSAGTFSSPSQNREYIVKADAIGNFSWAKMHTPFSNYKTQVITDNNDVFMFGTFSNSLTLGSTTLTTPVTYSSTYITKIDNSGNYLWAKKYGTETTNFNSATKKDNKLFLCGITSNISSNQFDTLTIVYANSLLPANAFTIKYYLIETDLNGFASKGAIYSFEVGQFNTEGISASNSKIYITGNTFWNASFGQYSIIPTPHYTNNFVAVFLDSANIIKGRTYYDFNSNGIYDGVSENCSMPLKLTNGTHEYLFISNDRYEAGTDIGTYITTVPNPPLYYNYSPLSYTSSFATLSNQIDSLNDFAFQPIPGQNDLVIDMTLGYQRAGFVSGSGGGFVNLKNIGTTAKSGLMTVEINNPDVSIFECNPSAISIVGNTATLAYNLLPSQQITYYISTYILPTAIVGSNVQAIAEVIDPTDLTQQNNIDTANCIISASYDPNNKEVFPGGDISPAFVANGTPLEYVVNFQNTGTDTAFVVVIRDTISSLLNLYSFQLISSSHPVQVEFYGNEIWFRFYHINLPDSTTNEPLSHGFVKYSIVPKSTCVLGDEINNTAYIYFDYNTPIITNTTNTVVVEPNGIDENKTISNVVIYPNPSNQDFVYVKANTAIQSVSIYSINGQLIKVFENLASYQVSINTSGMTDGVYFISVETENGNSKHKLIKLK